MSTVHVVVPLWSFRILKLNISLARMVVVPAGAAGETELRVVNI
jgi:hypothetical protein